MLHLPLFIFLVVLFDYFFVCLYFTVHLRYSFLVVLAALLLVVDYMYFFLVS